MRFLSALSKEGRVEFASLMAETRANLCLIASAYQDSTIWGLLSHDLNIRCAYINDTLMRPSDKLLPPVSTSVIPDGSLVSEVQISLIWRALLSRKRLAEWTSAKLGLGVDWRKQFTELAECAGIRSGH
ncbi:MAG: hypothetical protein WKF37_13650 [Bryobacteraceae bacterium]